MGPGDGAEGSIGRAGHAGILCRKESLIEILSPPYVCAMKRILIQHLSQNSRLLASMVLAWGCWFPAHALGAEAEKTVPKGSRLLGCNVTEPENKNYDAAMGLAKSAGAQVVSLKLDWDAVEKKPNVFTSPWPKVANAYYPRQNIQVSLRVATLDTDQNRIPADLRDKPLNDPAVIARFNQLMDWVFAEMPDVNLAELSIGNEVDGVLGADPVKWKQYTEFFAATRKHALQKRTGLKVGVSIMFGGHTKHAAKFAAAINEQTDVVMVSYYPLTPAFAVRAPQVVHDDFNAICRMYPNRPISFVEAGYPSGSGCGSSEAKQQQFVNELFAAWDEHPEQIRLVTFVWLHDIVPAAVDTFGKYYGVSSTAFRDYLGTLGLRTYKNAGSDKPAFTSLKQQAKARGW
jgi:hypothetical protein